MPSIITASQLRTVLGVSSSLYSDAYLDGIIDSAEQVILPMLTANQAAVAGVYLENNVAYYVTQRPNTFVEGQTVVVTGCVPNFQRNSYSHFKLLGSVSVHSVNQYMAERFTYSRQLRQTQTLRSAKSYLLALLIYPEATRPHFTHQLRQSNKP